MVSERFASVNIRDLVYVVMMWCSVSLAPLCDRTVLVKSRLTWTSMNGTGTLDSASRRATLVCVYAPALMTIAAVPSARAAWIRSMRAPSWFDWNASNPSPSSEHCFCAFCSMSDMVSLPYLLQSANVISAAYQRQLCLCSSTPDARCQSRIAKKDSLFRLSCA